MDERRYQPRVAPQQPLELLDSITGKRMGRVVDISEEGLLIFSETMIEAESIWQCVLVCSEDTEVPLGVECLWSRAGGDGQHCWAGFHIIDITDEHSAQVQAWVLAGLV
ncbi:PilZ domain-containing protein [Atopomonas sediminilitoris]|uniref:PilZ domain-containing protein n=1 Tax=Atopomonas sediminilitoris TaxID=2919919 RepID=UPI001F4D7E79|nr:PilZ domain-containing protein [Atopomonas sediminilitoris]MCJ8169880.1 PilZ domain-containing protein [Atopomonas sediminilitoris]